MKSYLDITLRHNCDINLYFVLQKVFQHLHLGFVKIQDTHGVIPIGISFPEYKPTLLGSKLRLLSAEESVLEKFDAKGQLARFDDYIHVTGIRAVPSRTNSYVIYQRQQPKSASAFRRLVRRMSEREGISAAEAEARITGFKEQRVDTPYINVRSASSGQCFRLFILKKKAEVAIYDGFSSYGLSCTSTVPEF